MDDAAMHKGINQKSRSFEITSLFPSSLSKKESVHSGTVSTLHLSGTSKSSSFDTSFLNTSSSNSSASTKHKKASRQPRRKVTYANYAQTNQRPSNFIKRKYSLFQAFCEDVMHMFGKESNDVSHKYRYTPQASF